MTFRLPRGYVMAILAGAFLCTTVPASRGESDRPEEAMGVARVEELFSGFRVRATAVGQMSVPEFLTFLDSPPPDPEAQAGGLFARGWLLGVIGILLGGFLLNLTPCVLPMVPVNIAIIGAGARAGSRRRGFLLGGAYGLAMALVYGILGLAAVLFGATFGTLNASPWFNAAIALLFVVLAMGMFDLLPIDFSRLQGRIRTGKQGGRMALAFGMGGVAALLAGACVAPVLISVLLLSADLYGRGVSLGLGLPFLLGVGMGLPWPFAGAGMAFLPKPGRWMNLVKYAFGVFILATALYYGRLAWTLAFPPIPDSSPDQTSAVDGTDMDGPMALSASSTLEDWTQALDHSRATGKPVFLDFWATWCRVCLVMQRTTFRDEAVQERFRDFVFIKYQAEDVNASPTRELLARFGVLGLPTYLILDPPPEPEDG